MWLTSDQPRHLTSAQGQDLGCFVEGMDEKGYKRWGRTQCPPPLKPEEKKKPESKKK